jgi:hypothetical protein
MSTSMSDSILEKAKYAFISNKLLPTKVKISNTVAIYTWLVVAAGIGYGIYSGVEILNGKTISVESGPAGGGIGDIEPNELDVVHLYAKTGKAYVSRISGVSMDWKDNSVAVPIDCELTRLYDYKLALVQKVSVKLMYTIRSPLMLLSCIDVQSGSTTGILTANSVAIGECKCIGTTVSYNTAKISQLNSITQDRIIIQDRSANEAVLEAVVAFFTVFGWISISVKLLFKEGEDFKEDSVVAAAADNDRSRLGVHNVTSSVGKSDSDDGEVVMATI